ncbi:MAG TPA: hypothetical protein VJ650_08485 [Gemmatimonadaceae bacterium]|nr:hypothetical protein [Gemmatimonadaceae bacterium]
MGGCGPRPGDRSSVDTSADADSPVIIEGDFSIARTPCPAGATYTLGDTLAWATMIEEGKRVVLSANGAVIDTVETLFGVHRLGQDSLVFLPVRAYDADSAEVASLPAPAAWPTDHVLCTPSGRRTLGEVVPHFNAGFSSPAVIDSAVYYWGMKPEGNQGSYRLYAMRYAPRQTRLDSIFLREEAPATDYRYFYGPPFKADGAIVFDGGDARALIDPTTWRVIRIEARPPSPRTP